MNGSNQIAAINVDKIDSCILELSNYIEKLKNTFIRLDDTINSTSDFYKCSNADEIRKKYSLFSDNYSVIVNNMISYIEELQSLKKHYIGLSDQLSRKITQNAVNLESNYNRFQG